MTTPLDAKNAKLKPANQRTEVYFNCLSAAWFDAFKTMLATTKKLKAFAADTILMVNMLEHLKDDEGVLGFFASMVGKGGRLVVMVPALPCLYNRLDEEAGHHRRYAWRSLTRKMERAGWEVASMCYQNLPGVAGWILAGALARLWKAESALNASTTNGLIVCYDRILASIPRVMDPLTSHLAGLSLLAVGEKL